MKYYIIAGEASGDLHGSNLINAIKKLDQQAVFRVWGGDRMQEQGADLVVHYRHLAFMGFVEVLANLRTISKLLKRCQTDIKHYKPDVLILIDYPGFNLRMARFAHNSGIRVFYYISPQIWAWKRSRVFQIKKWVDRMFVILPFEKDFYARYGVDVDFAGHPLLDAITAFRESTKAHFEFQAGQKPIIALLPGSRRQEVNKMLPVMISIIAKFPDYQFVVAGSSSLPQELYNTIIGNRQVEIVFNKTYALLANSTAALVTSGTATLETALFHVPQVVCYKGNSISFQIARLLVKVKYISLVNLIMDRPLVTELIQDQMNARNLTIELNKIITQSHNRNEMLAGYTELEQKLGGQGASARVAERMVMKISN